MLFLCHLRKRRVKCLGSCIIIATQMVSEISNNCVTRAISTATGLSYPQIRKKLYHTSRLFQCEKLNKTCYGNLLDKVLECPRVKCQGLNVGQVADLHPSGIYVIRVKGHATTVIDGNNIDTFDCRDMMCDIAWKISE